MLANLPFLVAAICALCCRPQKLYFRPWMDHSSSVFCANMTYGCVRMIWSVVASFVLFVKLCVISRAPWESLSSQIRSASAETL